MFCIIFFVLSPEQFAVTHLNLPSWAIDNFPGFNFLFKKYLFIYLDVLGSVTQALLCCWDGQIFSHEFPVVPEYPTPLLGRDLFLPLKSCSYCRFYGRCFKTLSWRQTNYFYQPPSETTPEWERSFMEVWSKHPQISSSADGKLRHNYIPLWGS